MNPLNNMSINNLNNGIGQVKNLMQQFNMFNNPNQAINMIAQNNPQMQQIMKLCNGRDPKDVFYQMCKERGIDPNSILSQLK